jgi:hypothetical protein
MHCGPSWCRNTTKALPLEHLLQSGRQVLLLEKVASIFIGSIHEVFRVSLTIYILQQWHRENVDKAQNVRMFL